MAASCDAPPRSAAAQADEAAAPPSVRGKPEGRLRRHGPVGREAVVALRAQGMA